MTPQRRASLFSLMGFGVWSAGNFLMNASIAKRGTVPQIADYTLAMAIATPICDFASLGLRGLQNSDGKGEFSFGEYLALRLLGVLFSLVALILYASAKGGELGVATLIFGLRISVDWTIDIHHGLTQRLGRLDLTSLSLALRGVFGFGAFFVGLSQGGLYGALWGQLATSLFFLLALDRPTAVRMAQNLTAPGRILEDRLHPAFRWHDLRLLLSLSLPVAVTLVIVSLNSQVGRYFTGGFLSKADLNLFGMVGTLVALERIFVIALGVAASTELGESVAADDAGRFRHQSRRLVSTAWGLTALTVVVAALAGRPLVSLIFKPEYARDPFFIVLMMLAGGVGCVASAQGYVLTALRVLRVQVPIYGASLLTLVAANLVLVPALGLRGAAWAMLMGAVVSVVASQVYILRGLKRWT
ncbi:N/A [soil metagenome]